MDIRETVAKYKSGDGERVEVVSGQFIRKGSPSNEDPEHPQRIKFKQPSIKVYSNGKTRAIYIRGVDFPEGSEGCVKARIQALEEARASSEEVISGIENTIDTLHEGQEMGFRDGESYKMPEKDPGFYDGFEEIPMIEEDSSE